MIGVRDGLREVKVPMAQAIIRALAVNAVKGQQRAQRLFTELLVTTERERPSATATRSSKNARPTHKRLWEPRVSAPARTSASSPPPGAHSCYQAPFSAPVIFENPSGPISKEEQADLVVWARREAHPEGG